MARTGLRKSAAGARSWTRPPLRTPAALPGDDDEEARLDLDFFQYVGTYRLISEVAEGGMGKVFLAEQLGVSGFTKTVGIKTIRRELIDSGLFRDLFIAEAKLVADLVHENIQQVYQLVDMAGSFAIVMEWVHGVTFEDINSRLDERNEYLPPELAVFVTSRVARALSYAHEKRGRDGRRLNVVHRDVSPVNVFASWQGVVKLADFGIAKTLRVEGPDEQQQIMGKVPYMAPEQGMGLETDHRTDIFALGLVLFEMLTGEQLYPVETVEEVMELHRGKPIPSPRDWNPAIPAEIEPILERLLARDMNARYQHAHQVVRDLEVFMYSGGYGPTNEKLADYLDGLFPEVDKHRLLPEEMIRPQ
ncbi:MAG: serine/threonine-protein kinase [Myxococcota bacterium]